MRTLALILVCVALPAWADKATDEAKVRFDRGNVHYNLGEYEEALAEYKEAYRLRKLPGFLFNIAQCHRKLGDYQQAINLYNAYLNEVPNAPNRADVESLIAESREKMAAVETTQADERRLQEEQARLKTEEERRRVEEERRRAEEARARALASQTPEDDSRYDRHPARLWALVGVGVGVAAIGGGIGFAVRQHSAQSAFDDAGCGDPAAPLGANELDACQDSKTRGEQSALLANLLLGAGAVLAGGSAIVWFVDPGNIPRPTLRARLHVTPRGVSVAIQF